MCRYALYVRRASCTRRRAARCATAPLRCCSRGTARRQTFGGSGYGQEGRLQNHTYKASRTQVLLHVPFMVVLTGLPWLLCLCMPRHARPSGRGCCSMDPHRALAIHDSCWQFPCMLLRPWTGAFRPSSTPTATRSQVVRRAAVQPPERHPGKAASSVVQATVCTRASPGMHTPSRWVSRVSREYGSCLEHNNLLSGDHAHECEHARGTPALTRCPPYGSTAAAHKALRPYLTVPDCRTYAHPHARHVIAACPTAQPYEYAQHFVYLSSEHD